MRTFLMVLVSGVLFCLFATDRYEAEDAVVDENSVEEIADEGTSGGVYINMKEGILSFDVTVKEAGFYTLWISYSQPNDTNGKIQNLAVNGLSTGQISFPKIDTFVYIKASSKIKLDAGSNTIAITKSWGWVNIDYIEIIPYVATPFTISPTLVTPNASENAKKMYGFLRANFQKKVLSGVMTNRVMENDGNNTPFSVEKQVEVEWILNASGKIPALIGFDFMHATGMNSESGWHQGYTNAALVMAEDIFNRGGFPAFCWHWKDPSHSVEAFYSPSASGQTPTEFDLTKAFSDPATCKTFNTSSSEYTQIVRDIDIIAGYLKQLADKGIPILWRPVHEASGGWFWWGYKGAAACKSLYQLMFDRFVSHHKLDNLIWVWTTDEAGDALEWYPGDEYVDIIGRDYYYYPREANHGSLVASFEKVKDLFGGRKIIALSENGSIPFADEMEEDGAGWSYFMPWYGDYTMDGWAHDNTAADWKKILNHEFILTLDEMPGWDKYVVAAVKKNVFMKNNSFRIRYTGRQLSCVVSEGTAITGIDIYRIDGSLYTTILLRNNVRNNTGVFDLPNMAVGLYLVKIVNSDQRSFTGSVMVR